MKKRPAIVRRCRIDQKNNNAENSELMIVDIENDEVIKILAKDAISAGLYLVGDNINVCKKNGTAITKNLSCQILKASRFSRNLNSLMRNMTNKDHPLNRVLVKNKFNESCFWLLPDEAHLRHPYLREITQNKKSD